MLSWDSELEYPAKNKISSFSHGSQCHSPGWGWGRSAGSVWAPYLPKNKEVGRLPAFRLWGTHIHGTVSKIPICPVLASRLLAKGSLCKLPLPRKKLFLHSPFLSPNSSLLPILGPRPSPWGILSDPYPSCLHQSPNNYTLLKPFQAVSCARWHVPGVHLIPALPSPPTPAWEVGDGHTSARRSPSEFHSLPPAYSASSLSLPLGGCKVRGRAGVNGVGVGVRGHFRPREGQSRKQTLTEATPPAPPPFAQGGSNLPREGRICQGRVSRALGNSPRLPPLPLPGGEAPPRTGAPSPPPPPSGSCYSLRLRSGSTSFLRRESEGCLLLGCEREKVRDHLARWAWTPGAGSGAGGLGSQGAYRRG